MTDVALLEPKVEVASAPRRARFDRRALVRWGALAAVLVAYFAIREGRNLARPLADHHNYETAYGYVLSLMEGQGFHDLVVGDDPASLRIQEFLSQQRDSLSAAELRDGVAACSAPSAEEAGRGWEQLAYTRVLDYYVTAGIWKLCGVRWSALYFVTALVGTGVCWLIFALTRRVSGNFWAGWTAAALFALSPLECHLSTWTIRDTSPLWFAALGFWFLYCVVDKRRTGWQLSIACFAFGAIAMVGIGWRTDAYYLVPVLGAALLLQLCVRRLPWQKIVANLTVFVATAGLCHAGIYALVPPRLSPPPQLAFHMACYADGVRCNLLGIENTFQTNRCDIETLFTARQFVSHDGRPATLIYQSPEYNQACREMFCEQARYNAFSWVWQFPRFYWPALAGLSAENAYATIDPWKISELRPAWLRRIYRLTNIATRLLPVWFTLGVAAYFLTSRERSPGFALLGFSIFYTGVLFLILPEQKHIAALLLPLHVFGGIGLSTLIGGVFIKARRIGFAQAIACQRVIQVACAAAVLLFGWAGATGAAYFVSLQARANLIQNIQSCAETGEPAPELLHGKKVFAVHLTPHDPHDRTGYLLKISAGVAPGELICRHERLPLAWGWPRYLTSQHRLLADRAQYFFVSCLQGSCHGDPRPYTCHVRIDGNSQIESCTRVDLARWNHLQVSTLFCDGESTPGSPAGTEPTSEFADGWLTAFPLFAEKQGFQYTVPDMFEPPPYHVPEVSHPVAHLMARNGNTGFWSIANSDGKRFTLKSLNRRAEASKFGIVRTGDFNGDGMPDVVCRALRTNQWYRLDTEKGNLPYRECDDWTRGKDCEDWMGGKELRDILVGDFNGDGLDDIAGRDEQTGGWRVALSNGTGFETSNWGQWPVETNWKNVVVGHFSGGRRAEIAGYDPATGQWSVATSDGNHFTSRVSAEWDKSVPWRQVLVADFNGDGRDDLAAFNPLTGEWIVALSKGDGFETRVWGQWQCADGIESRNQPEENAVRPAHWPSPITKEWQDVQVGDFNGDGRSGIIARDPDTKELLIATSDGEKFSEPTRQKLPDSAEHLFVGDFNGDGRDDIAWRAQDGKLWVGSMNDGKFDFRSWGEWPAQGELEDMQVVYLWPRTKPLTVDRNAAPSNGRSKP